MRAAIPFDILIVCQDAAWAENELLYDYSAEFAAIMPGNRRIYRLPDGKFASMTQNPMSLRGIPPELDIWNWWTHYGQPGLTDFQQSTQIDELITRREEQLRPH